MTYRLRVTDDGLLVLQVQEYEERSYGYSQAREPAWRDAKVTDIPVYDLFKQPKTIERSGIADWAGP